MKRYFMLGGLIFCLDPERPLRVTPELCPFYTVPQPADVTVHVTWNWKHAKRPQTAPAGRDLLQIYYRETDFYYCDLDGGDRGALACTCYKPDFSQMTCAINTVTCPVTQDREGEILRMLPMREIFQYFHVLFFHASQIAYGGKGILFTAPSGVGKTTQAKLWQKYRCAEIICNDRTLVRRTEGGWRTYGYPLDGSEPVRSSAVNFLGAIVLLEQGTRNKAVRLRPGKATPRLMRQVVLDCWSSEARTAAMELLLTLMEEIPIYLLTCTPEERAVETLEAKLTEDEVIFPG